MPRPPRQKCPSARTGAGGRFLSGTRLGEPGLHSFCVFETAHGHAALGWREGRITALRLPGDGAEAARAALLRRLPDAVEQRPGRAIAGTVAAIRRYFQGVHEDFGDVAIDLGRQEPFYQRVYAQVRTLRWGEVSSYGDIARALKATPEAARSVGQAMARNPVPLIVPCHRVLAAGGRIGGFSAPGGSIAKARMLEMEGAVSPPAQTSFAF